MPAIKNFPNNRDEYIGCEPVMKWLHGRTSGVFGADGKLAVTANDNMTVSVSDGPAWLSNAEGDGCVIWNDTEETTGSKMVLQVGIADQSRPRIDRVVASWDTINYDLLPTIEILQGTPARNPQPPALTNTTLKRQISLAQYRVAAAATKITASDITDERLDPSVCGLVTESIRIDTSVMQAQFTSLLELIKTQLDSLNAGTETMQKTMYDPRRFGRDIFGDIKYQYTALYNLDDWEDSGDPDYPYSQTVKLSPESEWAPPVTESSVFCIGVGTHKTGVMETDRRLKDSLNAIVYGLNSIGAGNVTTKVINKPTTDIPVVWVIRTEAENNG